MNRETPLPQYRIGDLVWCPWSSVLWPAMVSYDPHQAVYYRTSNNTINQYHIQYFGINAQRGWATARNIRPITNVKENGKSKPSRKRLWKDFEVAIKEVNEAFSLDFKQRKLKFIFDYGGEERDTSKKKRLKKKTKSESENSSDKIDIKTSHDRVAMEAVLVNGSDVGMETAADDVMEVVATHILYDQKKLKEESDVLLTPPLSTGSEPDLFESNIQLQTPSMDSDQTPSIDNAQTPLTDDGHTPSLEFNVQTPLVDGDQTPSTKISSNQPFSTDSPSVESELQTPSTNNDQTLLTIQTLSTNDNNQTPSHKTNIQPPSMDQIPPDMTTHPKSSHIQTDTGIYCCICDDTDPTITCMGYCTRSYHIDCLGIISLPATYGPFICDECQLNPTVCYVCKDTESTLPVLPCKHPNCNKYYHLSCTESSKNTVYDSKSGTLTCDLHVCSKCDKHIANKKLLHCVHCSLTLHDDVSCLIAGCEIIDNKRMICYQHIRIHYSLPKSIHHFNMNTCLHCGEGGSLICCDSCSAAYHLTCLPTDTATEDTANGTEDTTTSTGMEDILTGIGNTGNERWLCPSCANHDLPTYESIVMVKCGAYRWWPAEIIHPKDVPDHLLSSKLTKCMFLVRFYASNQYYWTHHGRSVVFTDECVSDKQHTSTTSQLYHNAFQEALEAYYDRQQKLELLSVDKKQSKMYNHIKRNKYLVPRQLVEKETEQCHCTLNNPCTATSNCINRAIFTECSKNCHMKDKCQNQRISLNQVPPTAPFYTGSRGWGLKAKCDLKPGDLVVEYIGEVLNMEMVQERLKKAQESSVTSFYFLTLEGNLVIDASNKSNHARFINHSCQPNCETQKWTVNGETRIGIFTIEDIPKGTELTFDYRLDSLGNEKKRCLCGAPNCSGFLGDRPKQSTDKLTNAKDIKRKRSSSAGTLLEKSKRRKKNSKPRRESSQRNKRSSNKLVQNNTSNELDMSVLSNDSSSDDNCFICNEGGDLIICDYRDCCKVYHLQCINMNEVPQDEFYCSRHTCDICGIEAFYMCSTCMVSYCHEHQDGRIIVAGSGRFVCLENCN